MTRIHVESRTDRDGKLRLSEMELGVADAKVNITFEVEDKVPQARHPRLIELLRRINPSSVEAFPDVSMSDPWEK